MDIETFRWFMSTVAQVLGSISALVFAGYLIWAGKIRSRYHSIPHSYKDAYNKLSEKKKSILAKEFGCKDCPSINDYDGDRAINNSRIMSGSLSDMCSLEFMRMHAESYKVNIKEHKNAWNIKLALIVNGINIFLSLGLLMYDKYILSIGGVMYNGYSVSVLVLILTGSGLYLYYRYMLIIIKSALRD